MIKLGITGGIGSGKSTVSTLFRLHGIPVYNADEETKLLNNNSPIIREKLTKSFGADLYINDKLDKKKFASIIFSDSERLKLANSIIHPEVLKHFESWYKQHAGERIVAMEAAILFESGFHLHLDKVVTIYAPLVQRVARVSQRENIPAEVVQQRIQHQMPEIKKIGMAEYVIINDYENSLIVQVQKLIDDITHSSISSE